MQSNKNKAILACAGSGKTTYIVEESIKVKNEKVLIVTYTNENLDQIESCFIDRLGYIPPNIVIQSWFTFLLQEGVRPYQNFKIAADRVDSIYFFRDSEDQDLLNWLRYVRENDPKYYFSKGNNIYENKVSKFVHSCNEESRGRVIKRLEAIYRHIFIDEAQDLEGWDLDIVGMLFNSNISMTIVGDPRQKILKTHRSNKNKKYNTVLDWLKDSNIDYSFETRNESFRCNQLICDFSDLLFPELIKSKSLNMQVTEHDGIFKISKDDLAQYISKYNPKILRYDRNSQTFCYSALNIGLSKGRTYDRVLIFPTNPMKKFLRSHDPRDAGDKSKLYVAVTRARFSVAFLI